MLVSSRLDDHGHCVGATVTLSQLKHYDRHGLPAHSGPARAAAASAGHPVDPPTRIEDRERLAAHLNNVVMSGLMSIGMGLQGTREGLIRPEDKTRFFPLRGGAGRDGPRDPDNRVRAGPGGT